MPTEISGSTGIDKVQDSSITSAKIADGAITNTDINSSAAIAGTKLVMPSGSILQIVQNVVRNKVVVSTTTTQIIDKSITLKGTNSSLFIMVQIPVGGHNDGDKDVDVALAVGWKTGAASATSTDYTTISGSNFSREAVSGLNSWFASDTLMHNQNYDEYWMHDKSWNYKYDLSLAAGTAINVAQFVSAGNGTITFGAAENVSYSDSGQELTLTIMEMAG